MTWLIAVLVVVMIGNFGIVYAIWQRSKKVEDPKDDKSLFLIQNQIQELARTLDTRVSESSKQMHDTVRTQYGESTKLIKEITEELTHVKETGRRVEGFAEQLQSLQDILKNPKQRGVLGEYYLETLLKNVLPPGSYEMQYQLGKSEDGGDLIPDAVVFVKDKIIPVDSKFSLENYNKLVEATETSEKERLEKIFVNDLKNRIVETSKYIQPSKGTLEFAFMFIPHEAIYYDLLTNKVGALKTEDTENLIQRAASKYKVIIVSPTSFLAYLQTVLQGLKAMQIEETASQIIGKVSDLGKHLKAYEEYYGKLGNALSTTVNHYNAAGKELKKIDKDVLRIAGDAPGLEVAQLEKPAIVDN
jgi:DNA recombination protein RmuC